jgi:hypothetical protein
MRWAGHVEPMEEIKMHTIFLLENMDGRDNLVELSIDGKIILERILGKDGRRMWTGFIWLRVGTKGRLL